MKPLLALVLLLAAAGCASGRLAYRDADNDFKQGRFEQAQATLEKGLKAEEEGRDQLLFLLDLGMVTHVAGNYEASNRYFLEAEKAADLKDYTSLAAEGATLLTSDQIKHYQGENFEKVLINAFLAINYAVQGNLEDALVEARKVNRKLTRMIDEGKRQYELSAFATYFASILQEARGEWDDARISNALALKLRPEESLPAPLRKPQTEIVVVFENGLGPVKVPHPSWYQIPQFVPRYNPVVRADVYLNGEKRGPTVVLDNIESQAIQNLRDKYGGLIAKKIAGIVAKEVIGDQVGKATKSPELGLLTKLAFYLSDQADTRSWLLLPKELQLARFSVSPGEYEVKIETLGDGSPVPAKKVKVARGQKVFVAFRYLPR